MIEDNSSPKTSPLNFFREWLKLAKTILQEKNKNITVRSYV
jgi:hypothetical protein